MPVLRKPFCWNGLTRCAFCGRRHLNDVEFGQASGSTNIMHSADPFLFQLFLIFVWAKLCGEVFERLHLPAVLGEILAGVIIGPYGAQLVVPSDSIYAIAGIGAIFLLFTVGLETRPKDLIQVGQTSLYVARRELRFPLSAASLTCCWPSTPRPKLLLWLRPWWRQVSGLRPGFSMT